MLRTPTTYLLPVTVISPAMCVEAMMISAPLNSLLYSPTAQLFTVWSMFDWVKNWSTLHLHDHGTALSVATHSQNTYGHNQNSLLSRLFCQLFFCIFFCAVRGQRRTYKPVQLQ